MECSSLVFSGHAVRRMFERGIREDAVLAVIQSGEVIAEYPDDVPFPSYLILGFVGGQSVHVALALDAAKRTCHVVTAYVPNPGLWSDDFKTRRNL
jgi:hypothetical protein